MTATGAQPHPHGDAQASDAHPVCHRGEAGASLAAIVLDLCSSDEDVREQALELLFEMVECVTGEDGTLLGRGLRATGGITQLCRLLHSLSLIHI